MIGNFIIHNLTLPDHTEELNQIKTNVKLIKNEVTELKADEVITLTPAEYNNLYDKIIKQLDYVGILSMSVFNVEEDLEELYILKYKNSPKKATELWWAHYELMHKPYTNLKNTCHKMVDDLHKIYKKSLVFCNKT